MVDKDEEIRRLRRRVEWLELALEGAEIAWWDHHFQDNRVFRSDRWATMLGYEPEEIASGAVAWLDLIHPDDLPEVERQREAHEGGKVPLFRVEHRLRAKNGEWRWILNWGRVVERDAEGRPVRGAGIHLDITTRKRAEAALAESEERFRKLADLLPQAVYEIGEDGVIEYANRHGVESTGHGSADELRGLLLADLIAPAERARFSDSLDGCDLFPDRCLGEYPMVRRDLSVLPTLMYARPLLRGDRRHRLVMAVDISDRKRIEAELRHADKLETVGTLAGGIAHDFNNLLTTILGYVSLTRLNLESPHSEADLIDQLDQAADAAVRARDLTEQLLTFSKGGAPVREATSIDELVRESATFALHGSNVDCEIDIAPDLGAADVAAGQISQVLHNLLINADQAMADGGTIRVSCRKVVLGENSPHTLSAGPYVEIVVRDQGVGIPAEDVERVFDPFFTTKPGGSGLGLATAYSIVRNHGGTLSLASQAGTGSEFTLLLPASDLVPLSRPSLSDGKFAGEGRVLIVDDDDNIRTMAGELTRQLGYEPELASEGGEAIRLYCDARDAGRPFDIVVLDLTIPGGMGGLETLQRLREIDDSVPAIVSSGYSSDPVLAEYRRYGFSGRLAKPYRFEDLGRVLETVLRAARSVSD